MSLLAHFATAARLRGIHGDALANCQRLEASVGRVVADGLDERGELVPENQGTGHWGITDPGILIGMEIAPTDTGCLDLQQDLSGPGRPRRGDLLNAQIRRPVKSRGPHPSISSRVASWEL
jgi:hypothetical protein